MLTNFCEHKSASASSEASFNLDLCLRRPDRTKQSVHSRQSALLALPVSLAMFNATQPCVLAQSASEASRDLSDIQNNDPQGFTWMLICIGIIVTAAVSLITVTTVLAMKGKKRA